MSEDLQKKDTFQKSLTNFDAFDPKLLHDSVQDFEALNPQALIRPTTTQPETSAQPEAPPPPPPSNGNSE